MMNVLCVDRHQAPSGQKAGLLTNPPCPVPREVALFVEERVRGLGDVVPLPGTLDVVGPGKWFRVKSDADIHVTGLPSLWVLVDDQYCVHPG